jgi:hypothetical protein
MIIIKSKKIIKINNNKVNENKSYDDDCSIVLLIY